MISESALATEMVITDRQSGLFYRYKNGDKDAFTALFDSCYKAGCAIAMKMTGDENVAEDIVQQAWINVLKNDTFDFSHSFYPWFARVVQNCCHDWFQNQRRRIRPFLFIDIDNGEVQKEANCLCTPDTTREIINREEARKMLSTLHRNYRVVLERLFIHGDTVDDVAASEHIHETTVRWRKACARTTLRAKYPGYTIDH